MVGTEVSRHPIEISPPDIAPFKDGNTGVDYVHVLESGKAGPNVMVQALTHGNEFCGAIALKILFDEKITPEKGKLTLAFANVDQNRAVVRPEFDVGQAVNPAARVGPPPGLQRRCNCVCRRHDRHSPYNLPRQCRGYF